MTLGKIWLVARKEWREILRDKTFLALAFLLSPLMMVVCGYGINEMTENMPLVVVDEDRSAESRAYADRFTQQRTFEFRGFLSNEVQADAALAGGDARAVLVIPAGFANDVARGHARVSTRVDGTLPPSTRRTLEGYLAATSSAANAELAIASVAARLNVSAGQAELLLRALRLEVRYRYNADLVSLWFTAPALIVFVLIFVLPMLTALGVVREKETGSIYNVSSSTLSRAEFLLGKLLPSVAISAINAVFLWLLARYLFGAPFRGSLGFFAFGTLLYIVSITSLGLVLSLLVRTQIAAMIIAALATNVIGTEYSGLTTPISSLSGPSQLFARALPPMHYLEIVEGTFLKGLGAAQLWPEAVVLAAQSAATLVVAWLLFRKRTAR